MGRALRIVIALGAVLGIYAGLHLYLFHRLVLEAAWSDAFAGLLQVSLVTLALAVPAAPIADRVLPRRWSRHISWVATLWMGYAWVLVTTVFTTDLLLWAASGVLAERFDPLAIAHARAGFALIAAGVVGTLAMRSALRVPAVRQVAVTLPRWPAELDGFRIAQLSDIHIGPTLDRRFARGLVKSVNALEADAVVITGDLVDGSVANLAEEVAPFGDLRAREGVFVVTGNHDHYSGAQSWTEFLRRLGLTVLRNEHALISRGSERFTLAGVDDHHGDAHSRADVNAALRQAPPDAPVILLAHDPATFRAARQHDVDLQISGHTHGGQMWPFGFVVRLTTPFVAGLHRRDASQIYVSRGTGFWGPPMRIGSPAEITELVIRAPQTSQ